jgi:ABC-type phosphate/phosphonate transport system substrate-binding protein
MQNLVANARMYAVSPEVEAEWTALLTHVGEDAGLALAYVTHPPPADLEELWRRPDLGAAFMCGYPLALERHPVVPIAAPIPSLPWAEGRPLYRSDFVVREDSGFATLADTFGGRLGWTVEHSHSGYNAIRHHLSAYRTPDRPRLYGASVGPLVTPRRVVEAVLAGEIDVGPVDSYALALMRKHVPDLVAGLRVVDSTELAPIPAIVAAAGTSAETVRQLREAFAGVADQPWFARLAPELLLEGFATVDRNDYAVMLDWHRAAIACGYAHPE